VATARFRARQRFVYARALLALTELARADTAPEFHFGPMNLEGMVRQGLVISGDNIDAPAAVLKADPGLTEVDA
jgi:hypothetical protein